MICAVWCDVRDMSCMMLGDVLWYVRYGVMCDGMMSLRLSSILQRNMLQHVLQHAAAQRVPAHCSTRLLLNRFC